MTRSTTCREVRPRGGAPAGSMPLARSARAWPKPRRGARAYREDGGGAAEASSAARRQGTRAATATGK